MNNNKAAAKIRRPLLGWLGSVRALLAIILTLGIIGLVVAGIDPGPVSALAGMAVTFYFTKDSVPKQ